MAYKKSKNSNGMTGEYDELTAGIPSGGEPDAPQPSASVAEERLTAETSRLVECKELALKIDGILCALTEILESANSSVHALISNVGKAKALKLDIGITEEARKAIGSGIAAVVTGNISSVYGEAETVTERLKAEGEAQKRASARREERSRKTRDALDAHLKELTGKVLSGYICLPARYAHACLWLMLIPFLMSGLTCYGFLSGRIDMGFTKMCWIYLGMMLAPAALWAIAAGVVWMWDRCNNLQY